MCRWFLVVILVAACGESGADSRADAEVGRDSTVPNDSGTDANLPDVDPIDTDPIDTSDVMEANEGILRDGERYTIVGVGFGSKSPVEPWLYDDFQGQPIGTALDGRSPTLGTATYIRYDEGGNGAVFDSTRAFNGTQSAYTLNDSTGSTTRDHFAFAGQASRARYISYRVSPINQDGVYKGDRQTANLGNGNGNRPPISVATGTSSRTTVKSS